MAGRLAELRQEAEWRRCVRDEKYFLQDHHTLLHIIVSKRVDTLILMFKDAQQEEQIDEWLTIKRNYYYE